MGTNVIIVAISSLTGIIIAALTYYTTKQREREAEWRKEKLAHYKDYFAALAETIGTDVSHEARARYCVALILWGYSLPKMSSNNFTLIRKSRACLTPRCRVMNTTGA